MEDLEFGWTSPDREWPGVTSTTDLGDGTLSPGSAAGRRLHPYPALAEPFGEFTVTQQGGVGGIYNPLLVRPDGIALLMSRHPVSGSIPTADLERLQVLLTSEQFRSEAAANAKKAPQQGCADDITWNVTMGALTVGSGGRCSGNSPATPATHAISRLLADEVGGTFAADVPAGRPARHRG